MEWLAASLRREECPSAQLSSISCGTTRDGKGNAVSKTFCANFRTCSESPVKKTYQTNALLEKEEEEIEGLGRIPVG